jgi:hypothetical protein
LEGGSLDVYTFGDSYRVFDIDPCTVAGGNLDALDDLGASTPPVLFSFGTHVTIAQSTAPALIEGGGSGGLTLGEFIALK